MTLVQAWPETVFKDAETLRDGVLACAPTVKPFTPPLVMAE